MDKEGAAVVIIALALVAGGVLYAWDRGAFREIERPDNGHKGAVWLAGLAILFVIVAVPLAALDGRSRARFRNEEASLREAHPSATVRDYAGPEGDGLLFEDASGRTLLLRAPGGLGAPRVVALPPPLPVEPAPDAEAAPAPHLP
jgi:hypothetical protein